MIGQDAYVIAYPDRDFAVIESLAPVIVTFVFQPSLASRFNVSD